MTEADTALLLRAAHFAADHHRNQRRKGLPNTDGGKRTPYINHPVAVAELLSRIGGVTDVAILCAALLHDTIEDTEVTEEQLRSTFGDHIADIVLEVTDDKSLPKAERKRLQVAHAAKKSPQAKHVKLADKISNLNDMLVAPPNWPLERIREYFDWAQRVVAGVRGTNAALEGEFDRLYALKP